MADPTVPTWEEFVKQVDELVEYPFEGLVERYLPSVDWLADRVCAAVVLAEERGQGGTAGAEKKAMVSTWIQALWESLPLPPWVKSVIGGFVANLVNMLVEAAVKLLNTWDHAWLPILVAAFNAGKL